MIDDIRQAQISRILIEGYKSIEKCDLQLDYLNILIGANGAGKTNLISFFRLIGRMLDEQLQLAVGDAGGPDAMLHFGRKKTEQLKGELYFGNNGYKFTLQPTQDNRMMFSRECLWWNVHGDWHAKGGHFESYANTQKNKTKIYNYVVPAIKSWTLYHFHDTSTTANVKQIHNIGDNEYLRHDAKNLAAFLYRLKQQYENHYQRIIKTIRLVAPFFGDFYLRPTIANPERIQLEWVESGQDEPFTASALSDGTLRFICLVTVLLQPDELMPATILIDEPELGLHPYAISVLGGLMKSAALQHQLIISTQSVELVNEFEPENLIVVDKIKGASTFKKLKAGELDGWLEDYSLGELWKKNIIGGRPNR